MAKNRALGHTIFHRNIPGFALLIFQNFAFYYRQEMWGEIIKPRTLWLCGMHLDHLATVAPLAETVFTAYNS